MMAVRFAQQPYCRGLFVTVPNACCSDPSLPCKVLHIIEPLLTRLTAGIGGGCCGSRGQSVCPRKDNTRLSVPGSRDKKHPDQSTVIKTLLICRLQGSNCEGSSGASRGCTRRISTGCRIASTHGAVISSSEG